jgi:sugar phosphate isomerase/epimerase
MNSPDAKSGVSIRDQIVPVAPGRSFFDALRLIGADSIECAVDADQSIPCLGGSLRDANARAELQRLMTSERVRISALLLATDFSSDDADAQVEWAVQVTRSAAAIGVPVVRIDPWTAKRELPPKTIQNNFIGRVRELLDRTAETGVDLGMENHGHVFNDPQVLDHILQALPDQRFGLTLDTGNLYWWGQPVDEVYRLIERYAPRAKHTHIKNINYPPELANHRREIGFEYKQYCCPLAEGNLDLKRIVSSLRKAGYSRDLCVEDESLFKVVEADRAGILKRGVDALRRALN